MRKWLCRAALALSLLAPPFAWGAPYQIQNGVITAPSGIPASGGWPTNGYFTLKQLRTQALFAADNNPRSSPAMTSPPFLTAAAMWTTNQAHVAGDYVVVITGSGASQTGSWYVETVASCTTNSSGTGPSGTGTGISDGTCSWNYGSVGNNVSATHATAKFGTQSATNSYLYNANTGLANATGVIDYWGGTVTNNVSTSCALVVAPTAAGTPNSGIIRQEFLSDATYVVVRVFNSNVNSSYRVIVGGQYVSKSAITMGPSGWGAILIDFSNVGGRATRDIQIEEEQTTFFCGVDVAVTEGVYRPNKVNALTAIWAGDSVGTGTGADMSWDGMPAVLCDYLGVSNCISTAIGGTGYLVATGAGQQPPAGSGQAIQRVSDVTSQCAAHPNNIVLDENILNDIAGFTAGQIQAAVTAYLSALRSGGCSGPIFEIGVYANSQGGASGYPAGVAAEAAKQAAVTAANDPLIFFIPDISALGGSWFTGTGTSTAPNGTGNSDFYVNGTSLPHPTTSGHAFYAAQLLTAINAVLVGGNF